MREAVERGLKVSAGGADRKDPSSVLHGTRFVLVDTNMKIRGYYDVSNPEEVDELIGHARLLTLQQVD